MNELIIKREASSVGGWMDGWLVGKKF